MKILKYFSAVLLGLVMFAARSHIGAEMRYEYVTAHTVGGERYGEVRNEKPWSMSEASTKAETSGHLCRMTECMWT